MRGTPTRAPNSPRWSIAGVNRWYSNQTDMASKSNDRQKCCAARPDYNG